jgi:hypothetical protein
MLFPIVGSENNITIYKHMNNILLKFNKSLKKITVSRSYSAIDLGYLIAHTFELKDKIVGLTGIL